MRLREPVVDINLLIKLIKKLIKKVKYKAELFVVKYFPKAHTLVQLIINYV